LTGEPILIAALAGRALAQSARRAGFRPLVVDGFGDEDTREAAEHYRQLPDVLENGFEGGPLITALDELSAHVDGNPLGLVLGSGFEDRTKLMATLDQRYGLIGTKPEALRRAKDPGVLFPLLDKLGIPHPETTLTPPAGGEGWLSKAIGGAGGTHIRDCGPSPEAIPGRYFQRRIANSVSISVLAVATDNGIAIEMSRQWTAPSAEKPYRFGGATVIEFSGSGTEQAMVDAAERLIPELDLMGLVSFDFAVTRDGLYLLEINPRPGATLDIFDDAKGNLFRAHVEACRTGKLWQTRLSPAAPSLASAILYADRGPLDIGRVRWPGWTADRPQKDSQIAAGQPMATVLGHGKTHAEAERLCRQRLSSLADLLYTSSSKS
jgi:uncharacterized protein